jgi:hypothetical protein
MLQIGVQVTPRFERLGEFLADVRALDAVGAHSLWLDGDEDPWLVLAAAAAVTGRMRLVLPTAAATVDAPPLRAQRLATLQRLAQQRVIVCDPPVDVTADAGAPMPAGRWVRIALPADISGWRALLHACEQAGVAGVVVRNDHRLLDLLRNPDQDDDRSDLQLAQG